MKAPPGYWAASTKYIRFARSIGARVTRIRGQGFKVEALSPTQEAALDDKRNALDLEIGL